MEIFVESDKKLKNYYPSWLEPEQADFLKLFNRLPARKRELILEGFVKIVEAAL